jgi:hypothetical protein
MLLLPVRLGVTPLNCSLPGCVPSTRIFMMLSQQMIYQFIDTAAVSGMRLRGPHLGCSLLLCWCLLCSNANDMCVPLHLLCTGHGGDASLRHLSVLNASNTANHSTHCWALRCHGACTLHLCAACDTHCLCHDAAAAVALLKKQ